MSTQKLVENIAAGNLVESKENFTSTLAEKLSYKIAEAKKSVAKKMCGADVDSDDEAGEGEEAEKESDKE